VFGLLGFSARFLIKRSALHFIRRLKLLVSLRAGQYTLLALARKHIAGAARGGDFCAFGKRAVFLPCV